MPAFPDASNKKEIGTIKNEEFYKMTDREKEQAVIDYFLREGGGTTFDPYTEFTKLPDDEKDKLTAEAIKIIEKREEERKLE